MREQKLKSLAQVSSESKEVIELISMTSTGSEVRSNIASLTNPPLMAE